jgi:hypothetical protein
MNYLLTFYFSKKFRFLFLTLTSFFLLIYILINDSFIFLIFFTNLVYVFFAYVNKPTLVITDNELIQESFISKRMKIKELNSIKVDASRIKFSTATDELVVKLKFIEESDKTSLLEFVSEQSLTNY